MYEEVNSCNGWVRLKSAECLREIRVAAVNANIELLVLELEWNIQP